MSVVIQRASINQTPVWITNDLYYYSFTDPASTYSITFSQNTTCDVFLIGGGGGGDIGCGGGAGACIVSIGYTFAAGTYSVVVGAGGAGGNTDSVSGSDSSIGTLFVAKGGGKGGHAINTATVYSAAGGCSGGSGGYYSSSALAPVATNVVNGLNAKGPQVQSTYAVYGNDGGYKTQTWNQSDYSQYNCGSGGGIGQAGGISTNTSLGLAGDGKYNATINGVPYNFKTHFSPKTNFGVYNSSDGQYYVGGGGCAVGNYTSTAINIAGGLGGGGMAYLRQNVNGGNGIANTGSGGAGSAGSVPNSGIVIKGGNGGSGLIIIRFYDIYMNSVEPTILLTNNVTPQYPMYINEDDYFIYYVYAFTQSGQAGTISFSQNTTCDILLVGGGGGGSYGSFGAGGGAGAVVFIKGVTLNGNYTFFVGTGGTGGISTNPNGGKGDNTYISYNATVVLRAEGGGGGANNTRTNIDGGSGGGVCNTVTTGGSARNPGDSIVTYNTITGIKYGNKGGDQGSPWPASGGGGAGSAGIGNASQPHGGIGVYQATVNSKTYNFAQLFGASLFNAIPYGQSYLGNVYFGGGGGGGYPQASSGGIGGGGNGRGANYAPGHPGGANTGGGGGGGGPIGGPGGNGGTGVIIIRYPVRKLYRLIYNLKGISTDNSQGIGNNAVATLPSLNIIGYTFNKWTTNSDGSGTSYNANASYTMPKNNVTLYAQTQDNTVAVGQTPARGIKFSDFQTIFGDPTPGSLALSEYRISVGIPNGQFAISACKGKKIDQISSVNDTALPVTPDIGTYRFTDTPYIPGDVNNTSLVWYAAAGNTTAYWSGAGTPYWLCQTPPNLQAGFNAYEYVYYNVSSINVSCVFSFNCDDWGYIFINDPNRTNATLINNSWLTTTNITADLIPGYNNIRIDVLNTNGSPGGCICSCKRVSDNVVLFITDGKWKIYNTNQQ